MHLVSSVSRPSVQHHANHLSSTATRAYSAMQRQPELRSWLPAEDFAALEQISAADEYVRFIERLLDEAGIQTEGDE
jgi:hypothetical protein